MDADLWKEIYKLLDLPLSGLIALTSYFFVRAWHVPRRWRAAVPFCGGILVALVVPSPYAFTAHNVVRRVLIYAGGAAFIYELLRPRLRALLDDTKGATPCNDTSPSPSS